MTSKIAQSLMALFFSSLFTLSHAEQKNMENDSLWQITKALKSAWGKDKETVSKIFSQPLVPVNEKAIDRFTSAPFTLADGTRISDLDVRLWGPDGNTVSLISFSIEDSCITLEQVKGHFPDITLKNVPRGKTAGQSFGYRTAPDSKGLAWGFSFPVLNRECLKGITMARYEN